MESYQSFNITSCSQLKSAWFDVNGSVEDKKNSKELHSKSLSQSQTSKINTNAQTKGKDVKYTRIIVEERVKKIIFQCTKNNVSYVVTVFVEHIL